MSRSAAAPALRADWPAPPGIGALTTLRHCDGAGISVAPFDSFNLGNHVGDSGDDPHAVEANRRALIDRFALPTTPRWLQQVHGVDVVRFERCITSVRRPDPGVPRCDAAVTSDRGVVLAVLTADCLPVLLCAQDGSEVAAAHAGWRGLASGVLEATVASMRTPAEQLIAWMGPAAGPRAYEVGAEVRDAFMTDDPADATAFAPTRPEHWLCDLYMLARRRLVRCGVASVHGGDRCTIGEPERFFSHRRDGRSGRMATLVWIA